MTDEHDTDGVAALAPSSAPSPKEVTEVLCREVGAAHPDGALRQIRTMKRLLRSHYRVKQRLERYGVDSLSDAVAHIAELRRRVRTYKEQQREHALDRMEVLDDLMDAVDSMRRRLKARPAPGSSPGDDIPDPPPTALFRQSTTSSTPWNRPSTRSGWNCGCTSRTTRRARPCPLPRPPRTC